jgi:hypothetical protein
MLIDIKDYCFLPAQFPFPTILISAKSFSILFLQVKVKSLAKNRNSDNFSHDFEILCLKLDKIIFILYDDIRNSSAFFVPESSGRELHSVILSTVSGKRITQCNSVHRVSGKRITQCNSVHRVFGKRITLCNSVHRVSGKRITLCSSLSGCLRRECPIKKPRHGKKYVAVICDFRKTFIIFRARVSGLCVCVCVCVCVQKSCQSIQIPDLSGAYP